MVSTHTHTHTHILVYIEVPSNDLDSAAGVLSIARPEVASSTSMQIFIMHE